MFFYSLIIPLLLVIVGCKPEATRPVIDQTPVYRADLSSAVAYISKNMSAQIPEQDFKKGLVIPVDQFFNEQSAEGAAIAKGLQQQLIAAMASSMPNAKFSPLSTQNIQAAQWVVLAGFANIKPDDAGKAGSWVRLKVAFADVKTGTTVAHVVTYLNAKQFDSAPSRFSKEAPMYLTDAEHKDRTAVLAGEKRPMSDGLRLRAELSEAIEAYEADQFSDAETRFAKIVDMAPANSGALSGLYQVLWRQGKKAEAEKVFAKLAATSIDTGALSVRILFKLNSTEFIEEADLAQQYQIWLKVISQVVAEKKICLDITGHASASGSVEYNNKLSLSRATRILSRMQQMNPATKNRLKALGKGSSEAIVGTGANDNSDAIDRRVVFAVQTCG